MTELSERKRWATLTPQDKDTESFMQPVQTITVRRTVAEIGERCGNTHPSPRQAKDRTPIQNILIVSRFFGSRCLPFRKHWHRLQVVLRSAS